MRARRVSPTFYVYMASVLQDASHQESDLLDSSNDLFRRLGYPPPRNLERLSHRTLLLHGRSCRAGARLVIRGDFGVRRESVRVLGKEFVELDLEVSLPEAIGTESSIHVSIKF